MSRRLLLIGGGHSHVEVIRRWGLAPEPGVSVTLISPDRHAPYSGMLPGHIAGHYSHAQSHIDLEALCAGARVARIAASVDGIDPANRVAHCGHAPDQPFDVLSIDTGSTPVLEPIPGAQRHGIPVKPVAQFLERWTALREIATKTASPLHIVLVGASGDSAFSPLVSKLRENNKLVIGVGVKGSSSDLLIANCDEFIYYDDLVRGEKKSRRGRRAQSPAAAAPKAANEDDKQQAALDLLMETVEALFAERGEEEKVWGSMVKQALKRRKPGFSESYHGFRSFGQLLEEAQARKLLTLEHDEKSGGYIITGFSPEE